MRGRCIPAKEAGDATDSEGLAGRWAPVRRRAVQLGAEVGWRENAVTIRVGYRLPVDASATTARKEMLTRAILVHDPDLVRPVSVSGERNLGSAG